MKRDLVRIGVAMEKLSQTPERIEAADRPVSSDLDAKVKRALPAASAGGVSTAKASEPSLPKRSALADKAEGANPSAEEEAAGCHWQRRRPPRWCQAQSQ